MLTESQLQALAPQLQGFVQDLVNECVQQARADRSKNLNDRLAELEGVADLDIMESIRADHTKLVNSGQPGLNSDEELRRRRGPKPSQYQRRRDLSAAQNDAASAAQLAREMCERDRKAGLTVDFDYRYRQVCENRGIPW